LEVLVIFRQPDAMAQSSRTGGRSSSLVAILAPVVMVSLSLGYGAAEGAQPRPFVDEDGLTPKRAYQESEAWIEDLAEPPPFPDPSKLLEFDLSVPDSQFRFLVDPETLVIGNDRVVRYVVVVEARSGTGRNVLFEGMNCATQEYKSYAYGSSTGEWRRPRKAAAWQKIRNDSAGVFRYDLRRLYFCDLGVGRPWPLDQILHRFRTSPGLKQNTFLDDF